MGTATATRDATFPREALTLHEATFALPTGSVEMPQRLVESYSESMRAKMVPLHIIRPGLGKGRGRHLYEARMLEENAHKFSGWKMYVDHLSPQARRAAGGLPRSMRDFGGRIVESHWDPSVPANAATGHGQGAVVAWSIPTPWMRELIENDPEAVEASISANATGVRPISYEGARAWLVEGIDDRGSVDWVTEAGAGGRVVALMEASYDGLEDEMALLEGMTDDEFIAYVSEARPHLLEAAADNDRGGDDHPEGEQTMGDVTPEALQEALQSEGFRAAFDNAVSERVQAQLDAARESTEESQRALIESALADERELIRAEARADADRRIALRDMRDEAHRMIVESKLPAAFAAKAREKFELLESGPTAGLDVVDEVDDDGKVQKKATAVLRESVEREISEQRELLASANPTKVRGQGPAATGGERAPQGEGTLYGSLLQEAGVDPATAWAS